MGGPDTHVELPAVSGGLTGLSGGLGDQVSALPGTGRAGADGVGQSSGGWGPGLRAGAETKAGKAQAGALSMVQGDEESADKFDKDKSSPDAGRSRGPGHEGLSRRGAGGGAVPDGHGGTGSAGGGLSAARSNMPSGGGLLQSLGGFAQPLQQAAGVPQQVLQQGMGAPGQVMQPVAGMSRAGGAPGVGSSSFREAGASASFGAGGGGASGSGRGAEARLDQFLSKTIGKVEYAWGGGHGGAPGPSQGVSDGGGAGDAHGDYAKQGVDCSGFARWGIADIAGHDVTGPLSSQAMYASGAAVSAPRIGDAAFPPSAFSGSDGPHHVQLYIGNGMIAEAPQSGMTARTRPMDAGTVFRRFLPDAAVAA